MPFEIMTERGEFTLNERLDYYADDLESAARALNSIRIELYDRDVDSRDIDSNIRMVILALSSISHSLGQESSRIMTERQKEDET